MCMRIVQMAGNSGIVRVCAFSSVSVQAKMRTKALSTLSHMFCNKMQVDVLKTEGMSPHCEHHQRHPPPLNILHSCARLAGETFKGGGCL